MWRRSVSSWVSPGPRVPMGLEPPEAVRQPGQQILVLGQLHLQLTLPCPGPLGENVQDQTRAVQHLDAQLLAQHAHLRGGELVVKHRQIAVVGLDELLELAHLAVPQKAAGVGGGPLLDEHGHGLAAGGLHQGGELLHRHVAGALGGVHAGRGQARQHGAFFFYFCFVKHIPLSFKSLCTPWSS